MKQIKLLGVAFIAMLSLTGILAATTTAATLPNTLPEAGPGAEHILASITSKETTIPLGLEAVQSKKDEGTLEGTSQKLGSFDLLFLETEAIALKTKCIGLNDTTSGSVLVLGTYHIRDFKENGTLLTAVIFLLLPIHFECGGLANFVWSGCMAGALTPENTLTKLLTVTLKKNGEDNLIITVLNEANTAEEACQLLTSTNGGATKLSSMATTETISGFRRNGAGAELEVLVMRL